MCFDGNPDNGYLPHKVGASAVYTGCQKNSGGQYVNATVAADCQSSFKTTWNGNDPAAPAATHQIDIYAVGAGPGGGPLNVYAGPEASYNGGQAMGSPSAQYDCFSDAYYETGTHQPSTCVLSIGATYYVAHTSNYGAHPDGPDFSASNTVRSANFTP